MDNPCNNISATDDTNYNDTRQYLAVLDSNHDMSQGRQDADLRDHSRAAAAALMRNDPNDAGMIGPDLNHDLVQRELRNAVTQFTNSKFTSIGGVAGRSYERHVLSELFQDPMVTSFQKLLHDSEVWSRKSKQDRTASPHLEHTGYKDQAQKDADMSKAGLDQATKDVITNVPIGTQPLLQSNNCSWGSISLTWADDDVAVKKPDGGDYYTMDLFNGSGLKRVARFMMEFMYPETRVERGGLVIDGGSAGALRILEALPQIQSIVCPAVVGDSAALCWHNIGGKGKERNFCCFPTSVAPALGQEQFIEKSNVSSSSFAGFNTQFYYERPSGTIYDKNNYNVFSFNLRVSGNGVNVLGTFQFTRTGPSMGPTVGYLAQLLKAARSSANIGYDAMIVALQSVAPTGSVLRLNGFPSDLMSALRDNIIPVAIGLQLFERICFDIKRCGDWEQVESVSAVEKHDPSVGTAMLGTGDILCMAQARLRGECGAWHTETASDPTGWEIILFRNPKNVSENQVKFFKMKDIVGVLIVPLMIINNNALADVFDALTSTIQKCNASIDALCVHGTRTPARSISATNLTNVVIKCLATQDLLTRPDMPVDTDPAVLLQVCQGFKTAFDPALAQGGRKGDLETVVQQFEGSLLTPEVEQLVANLSPFVEKVRTALYSIGLTTAEVEGVCELGTPVENRTTERIFGQPLTTPTNIDGTINENWVIDDLFNYFAGWHTDIVTARRSIDEIINVTMMAINIDAVDVTSAPAIADLVTAFNDTLDQLKPYMSTSGEYIKAITRSTAACSIEVIRDINRVYKLKSLSNLAVPSRVEGGRRAASPEDLLRIRDGVEETRNRIREWWAAGEQFATERCPIQIPPLPNDDDDDLGGGGSNIMKGGKRSSPSNAAETYDDAVANYFDMLIQEVMGYLKLCDDAFGSNTPEAAATRAEGFYQAKYSFCKGTIIDDENGQLLYGPKLPEDKVGLLTPYLNGHGTMGPIRLLQEVFGDCKAHEILGGVQHNSDSDIDGDGIMVGDEGPNGDGSGDTNGYFPRDKVVSQWVTEPINDNHMEACINLRGALHALWSDSGIEVARDAYEVAMLQDTNNDDQLPNPAADADIDWFIEKGGPFVERAVCSVVDLQGVPTAFSSSQWRRTHPLTRTMGIAAGRGMFGLTSGLWEPVMTYIQSTMAGNLEGSRNTLSIIDELINESYGSYEYESVVDNMITTTMEINRQYKFRTRGREEEDDGAGAVNQTQGANQMVTDELLAAQFQHIEDIGADMEADMEADVAPTVADVRETKKRRVNLHLVPPQPQQQQPHHYDIDYGDALVNMFYPNANANVTIPQMVTANGGKKKKNRRTKKKAKKRKTTRKKSFTGKKKKARNQKKKKTTKKKNKKKKKTRYNRK